MCLPHLLVASLLLATAAGCSWHRDELEKERTHLQQSQRDMWDALRHHAPVGSRWAGHNDTGEFIEQLRRNDARINEIEQELGN
jgi:hypothetical protein